jgi:hypothetical protein
MKRSTDRVALAEISDAAARDQITSQRLNGVGALVVHAGRMKSFRTDQRAFDPPIWAMCSDQYVGGGAKLRSSFSAICRLRLGPACTQAKDSGTRPCLMSDDELRLELLLFSDSPCDTADGGESVRASGQSDHFDPSAILWRCACRACAQLLRVRCHMERFAEAYVYIPVRTT